MNTSLKKPIRLLRAGAWRTYTGGRLIEKLHGNENALDSHFPEEWIMSTVKARNSGREHIVEGLSMVCENDISLADIISSNPIEALGKKHFKRYGASLGVLVKLIDSAERLTIQVHPTRQKAKELFESCFGKTECWHILGCRKINGENPCIYFGFKEGISREYWKDVFDKQDIDAMLGCLHKFDVSPGDTFLIEGGIPHAIGAGCFLVEIQEPTDYTIRTERRTPSGLDVSDFMCHQGLGFDKMFDCFDYTGYSKQEVIQRWKIEKDGNNIVGYDNTEMFRLEQIDVDGTIDITSDGAFSGIYILDGEGMVHTDIVTGGYQYFISACCEPFKISGKMKIMRFYGPK
ncbi:MAG: class I mannose-6-phosphate isomerase [Clostridia bacterium]|nr:class I mannose-6-phosphate isomerase [Clostridia bacterium]